VKVLEVPGAMARLRSCSCEVLTELSVGSGKQGVVVVPEHAVVLIVKGGVRFAEPSWFGDVASFAIVSWKSTTAPPGAGFCVAGIVNVKVLLLDAAVPAGITIVASPSRMRTVAVRRDPNRNPHSRERRKGAS